MAEIALAAEARSVEGKKVKRLRNEGIVPGTVYGPNIEPLKIQFPYRAIQVALMKAGSTNLVDLEVDGNTYPVLAREVQRDIIQGTILHVDFLAVDMNTKIKANVPIVVRGDNQLITSRKAILITGPNSVVAEMLPSALMDRIVVDISTLKNVGDSVYVKDLDVPEGTQINNDPEEMIARLVQSSSARAAERLEHLAARDGEDEEAE